MQTLGITFVYFIANISTLASEQPEGAIKFNQSMAPVVESYLKIQESLAADTTTHIRQAAESIQKNLAKVQTAHIRGPNSQFYRELPKRLRKAAIEMANSKGLESARRAFYAVSRPITLWASTAKPSGTTLAFSSMAGGGWLQKKGPLRNPYYGSQMLECGEFVKFAGE